MRNFLPSRARRRSSRSPSPSLSQPQQSHDGGDAPDAAESSQLAIPSHASSSSASALRIRNSAVTNNHHPSNSASKSPSYVIRPLPWMSPTAATNGAAAAASVDATHSSYLFGGHYSRNPHHHRQYQHQHQNPAARARVRKASSSLRRRLRDLPPRVAVVVGGLAACAAALVLYWVMVGIAAWVLDSSQNGNFGRSFYKPLDALQFREFSPEGGAVAATADLEREIEQVHRLELLRRQQHSKGAAGGGSAAELARSSTSSYAAQRRQVLERIVPKWLHRNDVGMRTDGDEGGGKDAEHGNAGGVGGTASVDGEARKLETAKRNAQPRRPMITLGNMDQHRGNSCPSTIHESDDENDSVRTTLVIQASPDRMWILHETCRRWKDPIVVVVGVVASESHDSKDGPPASSSSSSSWNATVVARLKQSCPHLSLLKQVITDDPVLYPVNVLRNVALDAVTTSHVLVVDADFVPSTNLNEKIRSVLRGQQLQRKNKYSSESDENNGDYVALVVPAFERVDDPPCGTPDECRSHLLRNSSYIPQTFADLQSCVREKHCQVFQHDNNWPGHYSTRSHEWLQRRWYDGANGTAPPSSSSSLDAPRVDSDAPQIRKVPCFHSLRYEPYVVIAWCGTARGDPSRQQQQPAVRAPYYDERFYGYGKNKIEYLQHLRLLGYRFEVLPEGFIVHNPHVDSRAKVDWNAHRSSLHRDMDNLYPKFLRELLKHPSVQHPRPIVGLCPNEEEQGGGS